VYVAAVSAVVRARRLATLSGVWWAMRRLRVLRSEGASWAESLAALPEEMVIDAVTSGALILGSVRARTLLL
jgi:hypothetical protein